MKIVKQSVLLISFLLLGFMGISELLVERQLTTLGGEEGIFIIEGHLERGTSDFIIAHINYSIVLFENYSFGASSSCPILYHIEEEDWSFNQICTADVVPHFFSKGIQYFYLDHKVYYFGDHFREPVYLTIFFTFGKFESNHYRLYFII